MGHRRPRRATCLVGVVALLATTLLTGNAAAAPTGADATDAPVRFVVLGDTGMGNSMQRDVAVAIRDVCADIGCDFVVGTGDNIYYNGVKTTSDPAFRTKFEEPYHDVPLVFYQTLGNHDIVYEEEAQVAYSALSDKWEMPGRWYTHQHGNVLFLAVDTTEPASADQKAFVRDALADADASWVFAHGHHPYAGNDKYGNAEGDLKTFYEDELCGHVDAILTGHDHLLEWLKPKASCPGTELLVSGAGGAPRSVAAPDRNDVYYQKGNVGGFLWVEIDGGTFTGRFYDHHKQMLFERSFTKDVPTTEPPAEEPTVDPAPTHPGTDPSQVDGPATIDWTLDDDVDEGWVEVYLETSADVTAVDADVGNGTWVSLTPRSWGSWAASALIPNGTQVAFRATLDDGTTLTSDAVAWPAPNATLGTARTSGDDDSAAPGEDPATRDAPAPTALLVLAVLAGVTLRRRP